MVNIKKAFDEGLENLEKGFAQQVKTSAKAVAGQVGNTQPSGQQGAVQADQQTEEVVNSFYAPSNPNEAHGLSPQQAEGDVKEPSQFVKDQIKDGKTPEEAVKLEALRQKLHQEEYYIPLTERKPAEEEEEQEKKVEEQEKMQDLQEEEQKKKQDDDIALKQAQQKTEKFPGASG
ncbi:MAG: hypothetical protein RLZZ455_82 [Candidatus Parcubacteria bacterium]|jgi:hypothetical protein